MRAPSPSLSPRGTRFLLSSPNVWKQGLLRPTTLSCGLAAALLELQSQLSLWESEHHYQQFVLRGTFQRPNALFDFFFFSHRAMVSFLVVVFFVFCFVLFCFLDREIYIFLWIFSVRGKARRSPWKSAPCNPGPLGQGPFLGTDVLGELFGWRFLSGDFLG